MKTIAQQIKWNFETNGNLEIKDKNDNLIYLEDSGGGWAKYEFDSRRNEIYYENSNGFWEKQEWDSQGNQIYFENSNGCWSKYEYDSKGKEIYFEDSLGEIRDNRPKSFEGKVVEIEGVKYKLTKV